MASFLHRGALFFRVLCERVGSTDAYFKPKSQASRSEVPTLAKDARMGHPRQRWCTQCSRMSYPPIADLPKSNEKEFVIVRRDGLSCYLIESASLQTALKIEGLIRHN
jgi:hypothetical protein